MLQLLMGFTHHKKQIGSIIVLQYARSIIWGVNSVLFADTTQYTATWFAKSCVFCQSRMLSVAPKTTGRCHTLIMRIYFYMIHASAVVWALPKPYMHVCCSFCNAQNNFNLQDRAVWVRPLVRLMVAENIT